MTNKTNALIAATIGLIAPLQAALASEYSPRREVSRPVLTRQLSHPDHDVSPHEVNELVLQLNALELDPGGNNALFIGRCQDQGVDPANNLFVDRSRVEWLSESTNWVFVDRMARNPVSQNDIISMLENFLMLNIETKRKMHGHFRLIVIDSGVAGYVLTDKMLDEIILWLSSKEDSTLIFENVPPQITPVPFPYAGLNRSTLLGLMQSEPLAVTDLEYCKLSAFPSASSAFPEGIYVNLFLDNQTMPRGVMRELEKAKDALSRMIYLESLCDKNKLKAYVYNSHHVRESLGKRWQEIRESYFAHFFKSYELKQSPDIENSAPFVKEPTQFPSAFRFWWLLTGKL